MSHYIIYDPAQLIGAQVLRLYNEVRTGSMKPSVKTQGLADAGYERLRKVVPEATRKKGMP